jgi:hypothetical protein
MASPWAIITTMDAPSSNVFAMTGLTLTTYKKLCLEMSGVTVTTDGTDIRLTFYVATVEITGTSYQWQVSPASGAIDGIKISGTSNLTAGKVRILGIA